LFILIFGLFLSLLIVKNRGMDFLYTFVNRFVYYIQTLN